MLSVATSMKEYLQASEVIDWQHPTILELAQKIASGHQTSKAIAEALRGALSAQRCGKQQIAKACFEWVRDEIRHSYDYHMNPVTCRASDVLQYKTGYCYAKSHLLAALLRANNIPAGFCYQRLSLDDKGAPYTLHGFNAVYLPEVGWYRVDARGNREDVNAQFTPPKEQLAFKIRLPGEAEFSTIFSEPLRVVVEALQTQSTWDELALNLPDVSLELAENYGFVLKGDVN
jgi:transglutaminase-like putative cysteine protease